jgi:hypothetical protein
VSEKPNLITPKQHGVEVKLDPNFLLKHALYLPDGEHISKSNMTLGQAIEAIALAYIKLNFPHLAERCRHARIEYRDGKFNVSFADSIETLTF